MATKCRKCGESITGTPKFCVACGAAVPDIPPTLESKAFTPPVGRNARNHPATEPPKTKASMAPEPPPARSSNYGPPPPQQNPAPPAPQPQQAWPAPSPYGAPAPSYPANPAYAPYAPAQGYAPAPPAGYPPYPPQPPPQYAPPPFVAGGRVLVLWADGNRYPGIIQQAAPGQCLIVFPDGQQRWVEHQYLTPVR